MWMRRKVRFANGGKTVILAEPKSPHLFLGYPSRLMLRVGAGVLVGFILLYGFFAHAEVFHYYPNSCLGNWESVQNALGEPDTGVGSPLEEFVGGNSARYPGGDSQIFCGNFVGSDFKGRTLKSAVVHFSWIVVPLEKPPAVMLPAIPTVPVATPLPDASTSTESQTSTETHTEIPIPPSDLFQVLPTPSSSPSEPGAWRWFPFISPAFAEEVGTSTPLIIPESSGAESSSEPTMEIPFSPSALPTPATPSVAPTSDGVLEISYSLDGSQWNFLGYIGPDNWREASSFVLPLTSWEQLGLLQISLKGRLPFGFPAPQIYLDGMRVEAESLEPSILSRIFSPQSVPVPSSLGELGVFDPEAKHSCAITPFSASIPQGGTGHLIANLTPSTSGRPFVAEFGELPEGVVGEVVQNPSSTTSLFLNMQTSLTVSTGSYSLMFVYREKQPDGRTIPNFCQYNLVIQ